MNSTFNKSMTNVNGKRVTERAYEVAGVVAQELMAFAITNYDKGWDEVVECETVEELQYEIATNSIWSLTTAKKRYSTSIRARAEYAAELN